jgi:hypothetical protein
MKSELYSIATHDGHSCAFEQVTRGRTIVALYVVFDGQRIARRGDPDGPHRCTWVSMVPGFDVMDNADLTELTIYFNGNPLH